MELKQRKVRPVELLVLPTFLRILEETSGFELLVSTDIFLLSSYSLSVPKGKNIFSFFWNADKFSFVLFKSICAPEIFAVYL